MSTMCKLAHKAHPLCLLHLPGAPLVVRVRRILLEVLLLRSVHLRLEDLLLHPIHVLEPPIMHRQPMLIREFLRHPYPLGRQITATLWSLGHSYLTQWYIPERCLVCRRSCLQALPGGFQEKLVDVERVNWIPKFSVADDVGLLS